MKHFLLFLFWLFVLHLFDFRRPGAPNPGYVYRNRRNNAQTLTPQWKMDYSGNWTVRQ